MSRVNRGNVYDVIVSKSKQRQKKINHRLIWKKINDLIHSVDFIGNQFDDFNTKINSIRNKILKIRKLKN